MAHQTINGKVVVDWTTGDPEGDRLTLLAAYRDFIIKIKHTIDHIDNGDDAAYPISELFELWNIDTSNQIDEVPRIWIKRPE